MIPTNQSTGFLIDSVYNKIKSIVGTTYTSQGLSSKTITYVTGFPKNYDVYLSSTPFIFISKPTRVSQNLFEQGGKTKCVVRMEIHVVAGGYSNDSQNELMKQDIMDKIMFGFEKKVYDLINPYTGAVLGRYNNEVTEIPRSMSNVNDEFNRYHGEISLMSWMLIYNN